MTVDALSCATVLIWAAVVYRLPGLRRAPGDAGRRWSWLALLFQALGMTVLLPPVYLRLGPALGVPNAARLLGNGLVLVGAWALQAHLFHMTRPPEQAGRAVRRAGWALAAALSAMTVLFGLAPVDEDVLDFTGRYGDAPYVLEYRLIFLAYLALAAFKMIRLCWRYARLARPPALTLGLRVVALGAAFGFGYLAHEGLRVAARRLGYGDPVPGSDALTQLLGAAAVGLVVVGSTMPAWGPSVGVPALSRWAGRYRAHRCLYPLWRDLVRATPEIALVPPRPALADALTVSDLGFRLYRRVIEIRDGGLALRPHMDPALAERVRAACQAAGLLDEDARAVVEAACLAAALDAKRWGGAAHTARSTLGLAGGADVASEVALLERVAGCYQRSPIVRAVRAGRWPGAVGPRPTAGLAR